MTRTPKRERTVLAVYRYLAAALAVLWSFLVISFLGGYIGSPPSTTVEKSPFQRVVVMATSPSSQETADDAVAEAAHRKICHCLNCPGYKHCCCGDDKTGGSSNLVLRSFCDSGTTAMAASVVTVKVTPFATGFVLSLPAATVALLTFPTADVSALSRTLIPGFLPPRLS